MHLKRRRSSSQLQVKQRLAAWFKTSVVLSKLISMKTWCLYCKARAATTIRNRDKGDRAMIYVVNRLSTQMQSRSFCVQWKPHGPHLELQVLCKFKADKKRNEPSIMHSNRVQSFVISLVYITKALRCILGVEHGWWTALVKQVRFMLSWAGETYQFRCSRWRCTDFAHRIGGFSGVWVPMTRRVTLGPSQPPFNRITRAQILGHGRAPRTGLLRWHFTRVCSVGRMHVANSGSWVAFKNEDQKLFWKALEELARLALLMSEGQV